MVFQQVIKLSQIVVKTPLKTESSSRDQPCQNPAKSSEISGFFSQIPKKTRYTRKLQDAVQDENPLKWWKQNVSKYPTLSVLARQYFSIPGTSVPSERIFSSAGLVVSKLRNRLSLSLVDQIIFLSKNYVPEQKTDD